MKKSLVNVIFSSVLIFGLSGCGGGQPKVSNNKTKEAHLGNGSVIGYAYMQNGDKLLSINDGNTIEKDNIETVLITTSGFYPSYSLKYASDHQCGRLYVKGKLSDWTETAFCKSIYTNSGTGDVVGNTLWNSLLVPIGAIANPGQTAKGKPIYHLTKQFNKTKFLEIMVENKLPYFRKKLLKLYKLAKNKEILIEEIYEPYFQEYSNNIDNIELVYNTQDKSKLLSIKNLNGDYRVVLNAPEKKNYTYTSVLNSFSATPANFDNKYADMVNKINHQFEEDKKEYKAYLETAFSTYKIEGPKQKTFKHNEHISFESIIKAPSEIKYKLGKKIQIPVTIIVKSATLTNMIPKQFKLSDSSMNVNFESNSNGTVSVIAENKTKSFITAKSLTSYYKSDVYSISNIDREISPETTTLSSNSNYSLLSDTMISASNFKGITKAKAKSIKINYGYAVKYRLNNTNVNKSMYDTKKYSLYNIFQQYL